MQILLPTKINRKIASIKVETLKIFLLAFNKSIPSKVSQKPKQIKINGKKMLGSDLLIIIFKENKGNEKPKQKLIKKKVFLIKSIHHQTNVKLCILI